MSEMPLLSPIQHICLTTTQRDGLGVVGVGTEIFNTTVGLNQIWDGTNWQSKVNAPVTAPRVGNFRFLTHSYGSVNGSASLVGNFSNFMRKTAAAFDVPVREIDFWFHGGSVAGVPNIGDPISGITAPFGGIGGAFRHSRPSHSYSQPGYTAPQAGSKAYSTTDIICMGANDIGVGGTAAGNDPNLTLSAIQGLRAVLAWWRARAAYSVSDASVAFNGTWSGVLTDLNYVSFGKYNSTSTLNDYVEFTLPATYKGEVVALLLLGNPNAYTTLTAPITTAPAVGTSESWAVATRTVFPQAAGSPQFVIQIDAEQMLVTAGWGTGAGSLTFNRGYNGTTPATHLSGAAVTRSKATLYLDFTASTAACSSQVSVGAQDSSGRLAISGQGASVGGLSGSTQGQPIQMVQRFTGMTAADAGKKIRATLKNFGTQTGSIPGESFRVFAVVIEDPDKAPQFLMNQPYIAQITSGTAFNTRVAAFNTSLSNLAAEFTNCYLVDVFKEFNDRFGFTPQTATGTGTTIHITPMNAQRNQLAQGHIIFIDGEQMLINGAITKTSNTDWSVPVSRAYAGADAPPTNSASSHATTAVGGSSMSFSIVDGLHPSDSGHEVYAETLITSINSVPPTSSKMAMSGAYKARNKQGIMSPTSGVAWPIYRGNAGITRVTKALTLNTEYAEPFPIEATGLVTYLECYITTLGTTSGLRFCVYTNEKGAPGSLIFDTGASYGPGVVASTASAAWATAAIIGGVPVTEGWYWMSVTAVSTGGGSTNPTVRANAGSPPIGGYIMPEDQATAAATHSVTGLSRTFSVGTDWDVSTQSLVTDNSNFPLIRAGYETFITA